MSSWGQFWFYVGMAALIIVLAGVALYRWGSKPIK